ncbi:hypothetical protein [Clostridium sp. UBA1652]|uniref:hypothetical protein n=1 Tax=Clostridium sp. UBA1652 TaxID=1946348 RepID=UPI00257DEFC2|nr:hypothetical protein [Clostridium sp. UBA1652]
MMSEDIKVIDLAKELSLHVKLVTSIKSFDNFNSYFNIYSEVEEPCRRIVVITPYEELEEVYDENPDKPINSNVLIDGNVWIGEYPLITSPKDIHIDALVVSKELAHNISIMFNKF